MTKLEAKVRAFRLMDEDDSAFKSITERYINNPTELMRVLDRLLPFWDDLPDGRAKTFFEEKRQELGL